MSGKPNQPIKPAPLHPIPVVEEPFKKIIIDCVGPLPKSRNGYQFLLTIMCATTRYPGAIPMRSITSKSVVKHWLTFSLSVVYLGSFSPIGVLTSPLLFFSK